MSLLEIPSRPDIVVSSDESSAEEAEEVDIDFETCNYKSDHIETARQIFNIVLDDWMYGYKIIYNKNHYMPLFLRILELVSKEKIIDFLLPGFPVKSVNTVTKVLGPGADFAEFLTIRSFIISARKMQAIYSKGVLITIMSDYHTFDQYIGNTEEGYNTYHKDLKDMIHMAGADNIFRIINLSSFPEFKDTISTEISTKLKEDYGDDNFLDKFDENIRSDTNLLERYKQMLKFMQKDQETNLPGSPRSRRTRKFLKEMASGMMSQGIALDAFLKQQDFLSDYVRISIHHHHPKSGKFAIDLFKQHTVIDGILRTPWHHTVLFNTMNGEFIIGHKKSLLEDAEERSSIFTVTYNERNWLLIKLFFSDHSYGAINETDIKMTMIKEGCGIMLENKSSKENLKSDIIDPAALTAMIKEFGVVILRGFAHFKDEEEMFNFYIAHGDHGIIPWKFGQLHKVKLCKEMPGLVNEAGILPVHWDMVTPPKYMGISLSLFKYEEYTCREFLLYCKSHTSNGVPGATTFVDAHGAALALDGNVKRHWEQLKLVNEISLTKQPKESLYFGGKGNSYEYPLIQKCPWTKKDVFRWCELWTEEDHPETSQIQLYTVKSNTSEAIQPQTLEREIKKFTLAENFFFKHIYEEGDQVYTNNYTMLHGREAFTNERELWRLQLIPPSDNMPEHYRKYGKKYFTTEN